MNTDDVAIRVQRVSKSFKLPHEKHTSIKSAVVNVFRSKRTYEKQQVLDDISFEIKKGEFFGIVGRNGSGKSTLLKLLAGIYSPDKGHVQVNGKLTPFIELGVGFNPELTGRENVFLNGALLGFNRSEMETMYDEIVEFAELEKFMDQKLKNYSSGMQVRLAFSIAIQADSEILVLDEVLAVGDEAFQKKCIKVFDEYKKNKQTIVLVTHDMETVKKYCSRALLIDSGSIRTSGDAEKVAIEYQKINNELVERSLALENDKHNLLNLTKIKIGQKGYLKYGQKATFEIDFSSVKERVGGIGVALFKSTGEYVFGANTFLDKTVIQDADKKIEYAIDVELGSGSYFVKAAIFGETDKEIVEFIEHGPRFSVKSAEQSWEGITKLEHAWRKI